MLAAKYAHRLRRGEMAEDSDRPRVVRAVRELAAGAGTIFELIADPVQQRRWDGDDNLRQAVTSQRVHPVGEVFVPTTHTGNVCHNHVVEFDEGQRIGWMPADPGGEPAGHLWR